MLPMPEGLGLGHCSLPLQCHIVIEIELWSIVMQHFHSTALQNRRKTHTAQHYSISRVAAADIHEQAIRTDDQDLSPMLLHLLQVQFVHRYSGT